MRYATIEDTAAIHRFLCVVAQPILLAPIDPLRSMQEVYRLCAEGSVLVAEIDGRIVGTLGILKAEWWYADAHFLTDRWFFVLPQLRGQGIGDALKAEAHAIADAAGLLFLINPKYRPKRR